MIQFRFGDAGGFDMEVLDQRPTSGSCGRWSTGPRSGSAPTSTGTCKQDGDYTIVLFKHEGWREPVEFMSPLQHEVGHVPDEPEAARRDRHRRPVPARRQISNWT